VLVIEVAQQQLSQLDDGTVTVAADEYSFWAFLISGERRYDCGFPDNQYEVSFVCTRASFFSSPKPVARITASKVTVRASAPMGSSTPLLFDRGSPTFVFRCIAMGRLARYCSNFRTNSSANAGA